MKFLLCKKNILYIIFVFLCVLIATFSVIAAISVLPDAISYHPVNNVKQILQTENADRENSVVIACKYNNIKDICEDGPFIIKSDNGHIYVFYEGTRLYRINAKISHLTESDRKAIDYGIRADTKANLSEIAEYMES